MAATGAPHNKYQFDKNKDAHSLMPKSFASIQNHRKVFAVQRRQVNQLNCPLNKCCWRWQHQKLHIAVLQLLEAPAEMTRCTTSALCPRRKLSVGEAGQDVNTQWPPNLNPTMQQIAKLQTCTPNPTPPNIKHDNNKSLAENLVAGQAHRCTWAASLQQESNSLRRGANTNSI
jgi:hypothetical protein